MMEKVFNNTKAHRFELIVDGQTAFIDYQLEKTPTNVPVYVFVHTEVPSIIGGKGVGSHLAKGALEQIQAEGAKLRSACSFISAFLQRHPEYAKISTP